jgi:tetratricopeptide (TPR) repeat protein
LEPIGTITKYFPFLEEEMQRVLKSIMEDASDYHDFVLKLGHKACDEDVSLELAYIAALHVDSAKELSIKELLREKYKDRPEIVVWTFPMLGVAEQTLYRDEIEAVLNSALAIGLPEWMLVELYSNIEGWLANIPLEHFEVVRKVESLLDSNDSLTCFEAYRHWCKCALYESEGESVKSILEHQKGLELARSSNDVFWVMILTGSLGWNLANYSTTDAIEYIEEYNRLSNLLCLPRFMEVARHFMGTTYLIRGEYDLALECQFAAIEVYYHDSEPSSSMCATISGYYCDIEDGMQALDWAKRAFRVEGGKGSAGMHYHMARALLLLGMLEDAEKHVNMLHKLSLESASEFDQAQYLHARGLHELKSGNTQAGIDSLVQSLSIVELLNNQMYTNRILISLSKAEIQLVGDIESEDASHQWITRLEHHARKKEYPGILMHAALLRAKLFAKQGRIEEAQEVLKEALTILDSPSVKSLRVEIKNMLDGLIVV